MHFAHAGHHHDEISSLVPSDVMLSGGLVIILAIIVGLVVLFDLRRQNKASSK